MYGKHFESMYEGSMYGAGINVFAVWGYIISHTRDSTIELNPKMLANVLGGELQEVEAAIAFLCRPDPESRHQEFEGRRLVKEGTFQYRVPSWEHYQKIRNEVERREYNRTKQAEWRAKWAAMTPEEQAAYRAAKAKEHRNRKKQIVHAGACDGARQAIKEGFADLRA